MNMLVTSLPITGPRSLVVVMKTHDLSLSHTDIFSSVLHLACSSWLWPSGAKLKFAVAI